MISPEKDLKTVVASVLQKRAESSDTAAILTAARRAHEDLAGVMLPLIGDVGLRALSARAIHLTQREINADVPPTSANDGTPEAFNAWLGQVGESRAADAASAMLSTLSGLLGTFIGEPLTMRLLRKAWPDGFPDSESEETRS